ncbi:Kinase, NEK [Giardia muris]|uniref:Kinase, NEK n=1 Tax=Giardia muris TaxID=5742 RepID=A0A4Z1T0V7_GIAMU|nr:Kinase, NEK [Giardia muris]|eukprot:TNJ26547.1 Kinase, NEK [Giardia muris]
MSATALMEAAGRGDLEGVKTNLHEAGEKERNGWTALMKAAANGHANCIPFLEKEIGMQNNWGGTALMKAADNGKTDCIRLLLSEAGKQTTKEWRDFPPGMTALMLAAHENHPEIVQLLLPYEQGLTDSNGHTSQWHANNSKEEGDYSRVRKLLENEGTERIPPPKEEYLLMTSAITGDVEGVRKHLDRAGHRDLTGMTALMWAAREGHANCVPLLEKEIGMKDNGGETALMKAAEHGRTDCILLLEKEVRCQNKRGLTALIKATEGGYSECIPILEREAGMRDNFGRTALMHAALNGRADCIRLLLSEAGMRSTKNCAITLYGKTISFPPGMTALMFAAQRNQTEIIELLLPYEQGMEDSEGHTAQWYANNGSRGGDFTRVRELLENERTERILPPSNLAELLKLRKDFNEPTTEIESLKNDLASSKNTLEEARKELSQSNQEVASLKAQLSKTTEDLKRALADQKAQNLVLEKENARLRTENHDMKDLQRRLEEVEEEKRVLLQNLAAVGGRLPPAREDSSLISSAIQGDLNTLRRHLDQAGQKDSSGMTALMHAASRGQTEVVRLLRPLEARLQDGRGWTALMHAVRGGHEECVGLLLLEQDIADVEHDSPEDIATKSYEEADGERKVVYKKIVSLLEKKSQLPRLPKNLSGYHLTAVLGKGTFGAVYAGHGNGRNVAVKVVNLGGHDDKERELLRREAKILLSIDHPNIIRCLGTGEDSLEDIFVLVTELCCGDLHGEMDRRRKARSSYSDQEVWRMVREVADALTYLHKKRHVHRDLKPANILLSSDGRCVLGDFGIARTLGDSSWMATHAGTQPYMAPEIHQGENYNKSVDVWALGVIGYEMCTGGRPFRNVAAVLEKTSAPPLEGRPSDLAALISRMLSKDPEDRPTAQDVLEEAERHQ